MIDNLSHPIEQPILVTGATGMIGSALVKRLIKEGKNIHVFVLPQENIPLAWEGKVHIHWGDISEFRYVERAMDECETIFHLAAVVSDWGNRNLFQRVNVDGTNHVVELASKHNKRLIITTGIAVYGTDLQKFVCKEERPHGEAVGYYSQSLQAQERIIEKYANSSDLRYSILRPANVYGPGSKTWVYDLLEAIKGGPTLMGNGDQQAGLIHVENVVEMLLLAASKEEALGETFNCAEENGISWKKYQSDLARAARLPQPRTFSTEIAWNLAQMQEWGWKKLNIKSRPHFTLEAVNRIMSNHRIPIGKAQKLLGYKAVMTYEEGIRDLKEFLEKHYLSK